MSNKLNLTFEQLWDTFVLANPIIGEGQEITIPTLLIKQLCEVSYEIGQTYEEIEDFQAAIDEIERLKKKLEE